MTKYSTWQAISKGRASYRTPARSQDQSLVCLNAKGKQEPPTTHRKLYFSLGNY